MLVCHCHGLTDRAIRSAVREGAATCADIARHCRAGNRCGGCRPAVQDIIDSELVQSPLAAHTSAESLSERP
jgi:bacterioferritin-associated ferredoxin